MDSTKHLFITCALHIAILFNLAVAQPVLQKLAENPEFLVAHATTPAEIIFLTAFLCVLLPGLLIAIEAVARIFGEKAFRGAHYVLLSCLFTLLLLLLIHQFTVLSGLIAILASIGIASILTFFYRVRAMRSTMTILAPVIVVVPLLFLLNGSIRKLITTNEVIAETASQKGLAPVVMVVFDELPITSLMNGERLLDRTLYPNFAALANDFTWFRNTTTVSAVTSSAVPAILTGKYPVRKLLPTLSDHPENVFTLLGGSHDLKVLESATSLCPPQLNVLWRETSGGFTRSLQRTLLDLSAVYLQIVVPEQYAQHLPDVTTTWGDFWGPKEERVKKSDRPAYFETFIRSIVPSEKPFFSFLHISLPHRPWRYLPEGVEYNDFNEGRRGDKFWEQDEWAATVAVQRHLLQLGYADRLLGELVQHLKTTGLYDRCLIVIAADHGISLWPGEEARKPSATTYQDILFVPFFVKAPFQTKGEIVDRKRETVDIVPTITEILGLKTAWKFDGWPAIDASASERRERKIFLHDKLISGLEHDIHDENRTLERKVALFGKAKNISDLYTIGPFQELLGQNINDLPLLRVDQAEVHVRRQAGFENIDLSSKTLPAYVAGEVQYSGQNQLAVAVAVNQKIQAVTQAFHSAGKFRFAAIVPPSSFSQGKNHIQVILITEKGKFVLPRSS